jgi:hypothetical protein
MDVPSRMNVKQAAAYACVCESVIRGWVSSRLLAHYRLGLGRGKIVIEREDIDALLASLKITKKEPEPQKAPAPSNSAFKHLRLN